MNARLLYREGAAEGASPIALVARLYEQMIDDLRQATKAIESNNIELRTQKINHAILVLGHLDSQLNFASGGKVAGNLRNFYRNLRQTLIQAQMRQSKALLVQQITDLLAVREAWVQVEKVEVKKTEAERAEVGQKEVDPKEIEPKEGAALSGAGRPAPAYEISPIANAAHLDWKG